MRSRQSNVFATLALLAFAAVSLTGCYVYSDPSPHYYAHGAYAMPYSSSDYDHRYWQNDSNDHRMKDRATPRPSYDNDHRYWQNDSNDHRMRDYEQNR